jgi:hypothetical protein
MSAVKLKRVAEMYTASSTTCTKEFFQALNLAMNVRIRRAYVALLKYKFTEINYIFLYEEESYLFDMK